MPLWTIEMDFYWDFEISIVFCAVSELLDGPVIQWNEHLQKRGSGNRNEINRTETICSGSEEANRNRGDLCWWELLACFVTERRMHVLLWDDNKFLKILPISEKWKLWNQKKENDFLSTFFAWNYRRFKLMKPTENRYNYC